MTDMRILSILLYSPPSKNIGGAERQMHSLHKDLLKQGVEVHVLAAIERVGCRHQMYEGISIWGVEIPLLTCSVFHPMNIWSWFKMREIITLVKDRIGPVDLIQAIPFREPALFAYWISKELGIPWVARIACSGSYGDFNFMSKNWLTKGLLPRLATSCSAVIVLEEETYKEALAHGIKEDKIWIISNAVIIEHVPPLERLKEIPRDGVILFLGRLEPQKKPETLIKAYSILKNMGGGKGNLRLPRLRILGAGDTHAFATHVEENVLKTIDFMGHQEKIEPFLIDALCLVNPSESEGLPNAVIEACAFGVPVILSDIPVHRKIAREVEMEDFLFPVGNEKVLSENLLNFLRLSKEEVIRQKIRCVQYAKRFSNQIRNRAYLDLYERVLNGNKTHHEMGK